MLEKIIELASLNDKNCEIKDDESHLQASWKRNEKRDVYYRNALTKIHNGKWFVWNWSAFLFNLYWMAYRKMYKNIFIYNALGIVLGFSILLSLNFFNLREDNIVSKSLFLITLLCIFLFGAFGNKLYYHHLKRKSEKGYDKNIYAPVNSTVQTLVFIAFCLILFGGVVIKISGEQFEEDVKFKDVFYELSTFLISIHMLYDAIRTKRRFNKYTQEKNAAKS